MSFDEFLTDKVTLLKKNGESNEDIKASVQKNKIFIQRSDILIEAGDILRRRMSNGGEETYEVIDPGFHEKFHSIPAGYQMEVRKLGMPEAEKVVHQITYNISGANARVNHNSVDKSVNITKTNHDDLSEQIVALRNEVKRLNFEFIVERQALELIDAVESQALSVKPSKTVVKTLLESLPHAGSLASIGSLIVSLLG